MNLKLVFFLLIFFRLSCLSQVPTIEWQKCYGGSSTEDGFDISSFGNGEFIIVGTASSNNGDVTGWHPGGDDIWTIKIDSVGGLIWQKCVGGSDLEAISSPPILSNNKLILPALTFSNDGDVTGFHGGIADCWGVKLDTIGNLIDQHCFGGTDVDGFNSVSSFTNGDLIFWGGTLSNDGDVSGLHDVSGISADIWIVKTDSNFNIKWQKCIGGTGQEQFWKSCISKDSALVIIGYAQSTDGDITAFSHGGQDFWICKLDTAGNIIWQKSYGGTLDDEGRFIKLTRDGGFIVSGSTNSNNGNVSGNHGSTDYWVIKLDSMGNLQWQKCLGGTAIDDGYGIDTTSDGGYVVGGIVSSHNGDISNSIDNNSDNAWLVKLDSSGNIVWDKCMGGTGLDVARGIKTLPDGSVMVAGSTGSNNIDVSGNHGSWDFWVVKLAALPDAIQFNASNFTNLNASIINSVLQLNFTASKNQNSQLQIFDISGRLVHEKKIMAVSGKNELTIPYIEIKPGVYFVRVGFETCKLVAY